MESAQRHGMDFGFVLRESRITAELLGRDASRVTPEQATQLIQSLWDATGDEMLGAGPKPIPRGTFKMMTLAVVHAEDLMTAMRRFIEFARIGTGFDAVEMTNDDRTIRLSLDPAGQAVLDPIVFDFALATAHRFAGWLIGDQIELESVELPYPAPPHAAEYVLIYGLAPTFDSPCAAIAFDSKYLRRPVVRTEDELFEFLRNAPADLLFRREYNPTTATRVRKILERGRSGDSMTVEDVAKRLSIGPDHLRRLLRDDGTSFRVIKEETLRDDAIASLVRGTESVEDLSTRLGFSEPSAFRRAFRRWTGSPPGAYRQTGEAG